MGLSKIHRALICIQVFLLFHSSLAQNSPQDYLNAHNAARAAVNVGPMQWDETVANYARNYANQRSGDCVLQHSNSNGKYGENLFKGGGGGFVFNAKDAVNAWVAEKQYYDYGSNSCAQGQQCGHYTQVVWRDSVRLGCARVQCRNNGWWFITCNYSPPGNYVGRRPY
ncbi:Pathogenesis-related protein PR-1 type-like protein [Heracleum sosnowskyi]|uniref:Pathogenesis-related protein PR-1 type-like protein n=1 Tax=Heracleum sosnowskyi TaxID=360622 RepID=A0AAD8IZ65_9APIA|nr:Pathogenesis-related protein PR-1 type-like protein [Heracleum sosnowskyi]KAK1394732.1 Pathogenesis-related protein PR-1 type-like protein [Heracleum sosnowskyi]